MEVRVILLAAALALKTSVAAATYAYNKVYLDDPSVCNGTIRLHDGLPAVLVRLSPGQLYRPLTCSVQIEIANSPIAGGLTAVVQELRMGKFDDPNNCTSYLKVTTSDRLHRYTERLCGEWRSTVHHLEVRKSLFGACDPALDDKYGYECAVREINLQAHVPRVGINLQPAFEVVVTAYYNPELFVGCGTGRFQCVNRDAPGQTERCISQRLVCDGYPNCGFVDNQDEYSSTCSRRQGTLTESDHFFATWAGFAVIVLLLVVAVSYFIRSVRWTTAREPAEPRARAPREPAAARPGVPEPPPYEALYPQGPPNGFLEKKRERGGGEEAPAPAPVQPATPRREPAPAPQRHVLQGSARGAAGAVTHIYVEPDEASPEEPPPYTERPALRHSILLSEAMPGLPDLRVG